MFHHYWLIMLIEFETFCLSVCVSRLGCHIGDALWCTCVRLCRHMCQCYMIMHVQLSKSWVFFVFQPYLYFFINVRNIWNITVSNFKFYTRVDTLYMDLFKFIFWNIFYLIAIFALLLIFNINVNKTLKYLHWKLHISHLCIYELCTSNKDTSKYCHIVAIFYSLTFMSITPKIFVFIYRHRSIYVLCVCNMVNIW